ncbi:regulatory protein RecX [Mesonia sp. K7]|uniref:regulatory protein RecX n=1 Tax=Mesonia sp. K7 TaxID=2218606 RepID=UPI000DA97867|nr:regulatory protein RecX [Mesonia sp. K7]PZD78962.1 recombinase RecX [Mesonia sp. K7]
MNLRPQKSYTIEEATQKLKKYCAYQERCHQEVEKKLKDLRIIPQGRAKIIAELIQENYLNEERFAKAFARGKFRIKKWGKFRIKRELEQREISVFNIRSALAEISEAAYAETLEELFRKKVKNTSENNTYKLKKKVADYLLYRGWESHLVYEKLQELD